MDKNFRVFFKQLQEQFGGSLNCKTIEVNGGKGKTNLKISKGLEKIKLGCQKRKRFLL